MIQQIVFIVPFLSGRASGCQIRASDLRSIRMKKTKIEKKNKDASLTQTDQLEEKLAFEISK